MNKKNSLIELIPTLSVTELNSYRTSASLISKSCTVIGSASIFLSLIYTIFPVIAISCIVIFFTIRLALGADQITNLIDEILRTKNVR